MLQIDVTNGGTASPGTQSLLGVRGGNSMPSPIFATPGMVTGNHPQMGDSPNRAWTAAVSDGGVVLKLSRKAAAFGKLRTRYGLPNAIRATGLPVANSASSMRGKSPPSATSPR